MLTALFRNIENPTVPISSASIMQWLGIGGGSKSGQTVTPQTALQLSPVWQAVTMISGDLAKMPYEVFQRMPSKGEKAREVDKNHRAYRAVARQANYRQSAFKMWRRCWVHALIWNNAYVYVDIDRETGRVELFNLLPDRTKFDPATDMFHTMFSDPKDKTKQICQSFLPHEVLPIESIKTGKGEPELELVKQARHDWGAALATQAFKSAFYKNNGQSGGVVEIPPEMTEPQPTSRPTNIWTTGMVAIAKSIEKQQLSEATEDQAISVARWFNLQPSRLGVRSATSYGSKTEDNSGYFDQTLSRWCAELRGESYVKLLTEEEKDNDSHYFEHNNRALLGQNPRTAAENGKEESSFGAITVNEYRAATNRNPVAGGDMRTIPMNQFLIDENGKVIVPAKPNPSADKKTRETMLANSEQILKSSIAENVKRIGQALKKEVKRKSATRFCSWWDFKRAEEGEPCVISGYGAVYYDETPGTEYEL